MEPEKKIPPELTNESHKQFYAALQKGLETLLSKYPLTPENSNFWINTYFKKSIQIGQYPKRKRIT